jgi:hypothetical protein
MILVAADMKTGGSGTRGGAVLCKSTNFLEERAVCVFRVKEILMTSVSHNI